MADTKGHFNTHRERREKTGRQRKRHKYTQKHTHIYTQILRFTHKAYLTVEQRKGETKKERDFSVRL